MGLICPNENHIDLKPDKYLKVMDADILFLYMNMDHIVLIKKN